jgi:hypothetical protein
MFVNNCYQLGVKYSALRLTRQVSSIQGLDLVQAVGVWGISCPYIRVTCGFLFNYIPETGELSAHPSVEKTHFP